ncbi:hypothetical protein [Erwinia pyrifoliae]|uniref:hypothetical protein n=1 Tax=Erwinia pyrifoliae TaxID=79967 RepID=UPI00223BA76D|nr:hypothetical protein [Erwinia pyrifoliae]MCT2386287.1 hypothetical protein [Erwinia pyrifoliae]
MPVLDAKVESRRKNPPYIAVIRGDVVVSVAGSALKKISHVKNSRQEIAVSESQNGNVQIKNRTVPLAVNSQILQEILANLDNLSPYVTDRETDSTVVSDRKHSGNINDARQRHPSNPSTDNMPAKPVSRLTYAKVVSDDKHSGNINDARQRHPSNPSTDNMPAKPVSSLTYATAVSKGKHSDNIKDARQQNQSKQSTDSMPAQPAWKNSSNVKNFHHNNSLSSSIKGDQKRPEIEQMYGLIAEGDYEGVEKMLKKSGKNNAHSLPIYFKLLCRYVELKLIYKAERIFVEILKAKILDPVERALTHLRVYSKMIHGYCLVGDLAKAEVLLDKMIYNAEYSPDVLSFESIFQGCAFSKDSKENQERAERLWLKMKDLGIFPTKKIIDFRILILARAGNIKEVKNLLNIMNIEYKVAPDAESYEVLIDGYIQGRHIDEAKKAFSIMKEQINIPPTTEIYNLLRRYYVNSNNTKEADALRIKMEVNGLKPDEHTYEIDMRRHIQKNHIDENKIIKIMRDMSKNGVEPKTLHYNVLMKALVMKGKAQKKPHVKNVYFNKAKQLKRKMDEKEETLPDIHTCTHMLECIYSEEGLAAAEEALPNMMVEYGVVRDAAIEHSMLRYYSHVGEWMKAEEQEKKIAKLHRLNEETYLSLIRSYIPHGKTEKANQALSRMKALGLIPDIKHYNSLMRCYSNPPRGMEEKLLARMLSGDLKEAGIKPDRETYGNLCKDYMRFGFFKESESVMISACRQKLFPNDRTFFIIMSNCRINNLESIASNILNNMPKELITSLVEKTETKSLRDFIIKASG